MFSLGSTSFFCQAVFQKRFMVIALSGPVEGHRNSCSCWGPAPFGGVEHAVRTFWLTCVVKIAEKHIVTVDILPFMDRSY